MRVRDREHVEAVPRQTAREVEEQGGHGSRPQGHRSGEPSGEFGGGIGEWREGDGGGALRGGARPGSAGPPLPHNEGGWEREGGGGGPRRPPRAEWHPPPPRPGAEPPPPH